jgi:hypothetical protein
MGEMRNAYNISVGKPEGKRPLGRPRRRWEDNIRMDLREIGCGLDSSGLGQGPVVAYYEQGNFIVAWVCAVRRGKGTGHPTPFNS